MNVWACIGGGAHNSATHERQASSESLRLALHVHGNAMDEQTERSFLKQPGVNLKYGARADVERGDAGTLGAWTHPPTDEGRRAKCAVSSGKRDRTLKFLPMEV